MSIDYYARDGSPLTLEEWMRLHGDLDYKRVALDTVGDVEVSTVWLGLNHEWDDARPPLYFETMLFGALDDEAKGRCWRWTTEEAALAGHERIVTALRAHDPEGAS
jgi:hypothetical protein